MDGVPAGDPAGVGVARRVRSFPRNGSTEAMGCAHMLCREPAVALLLFDPRVATAWLVDIEGTAPRGLAMCATHADRFRPPVGWVLSDQRSPVEQDALPRTAGSTEEAAPSGSDSSADAATSEAPAEAEPLPTPLLSRAFRTTEQALN